MNNYVIYGYQRSGTKLLADILRQNGIYVYGEFFDTFSSEIIDGKIKRIDSECQRKMQESLSDKTPNQIYDIHRPLLSDRYALFKTFTRNEPSVITVWEENLIILPELAQLFTNRIVLCTYRLDRFQQLLSFYVTFVNKNYNNEFPSNKVKINKKIFNWFYQMMCSVDKRQKELVESGKGVWIELQQMIDDNSLLGFPYKLDTEDQHIDIEKFIVNLDEVKSWYSLLDNDTV